MTFCDPAGPQRGTARRRPSASMRAGACKVAESKFSSRGRPGIATMFDRLSLLHSARHS
jgi:hypothetical protein